MFSFHWISILLIKCYILHIFSQHRFCDLAFNIAYHYTYYDIRTLSHVLSAKSLQHQNLLTLWLRCY